MKPRVNLVRLFAFGMIGLTWAGISDAAGLDYPTRPVRWVVGYPPGGTTDILARLIGQYLSEKLGPAVHHREQARRRQQYRDRGGDQLAARRLHRPAGQSGERHQRHALQEAAVQLRPRHRAGRRHHPRAECHGGQSERAGQDGRRVHRLRQGQSGQGQHGLVRQRHVGASLGRTVHGDDRREADPRAVSRLRTRAHRHDRRAGAGAVRQPAVVDRAHPGGQAARARGDHREALGCAAGRADRGDTVPGYEASAWFGMGAPEGTPPEVIAVLNKAINEALADPNIKARLAEMGGMPMGGTPADFGKIIADETEKWRKVVEFAGASVD